MKAIDWNEGNLNSLGRVFLRRVLENMRHFEGSSVRLGETGTGVQPNYQVTFPNGNVLTFRGSSHDSFEQADAFNDSRISQSFTLKQVQNAYEKA